MTGDSAPCSTHSSPLAVTASPSICSSGIPSAALVLASRVPVELNLKTDPFGTGPLSFMLDTYTSPCDWLVGLLGALSTAMLSGERTAKAEANLHGPGLQVKRSTCSLPRSRT